MYALAYTNFNQNIFKPNFGSKEKLKDFFTPKEWYKKPTIEISREYKRAFFEKIANMKKTMGKSLIAGNTRNKLNPKIWRCLDLTIASLLFLPATLAVIVGATMTKLVQPHQNAFHKQTRYGLNGNEFNIYKIRTVEKTKEGWRKTSNFAHLLRKYSIDEFPQLLNVFKGNMSIVGPRPLIFRDLEMMAKEFGEEFIINRLSCTPGFGFGYLKNRTHPKPIIEIEKNFIANPNARTYMKTILALAKTILKGHNL